MNMNNHIKRKDLIDFLFGTENGVFRRKIEDHLSGCQHCKREFKLLKKIFQSSNNTNLEPSENLYNRILSSYNNLQSEKRSGKTAKKFVKKNFKPVLVSAFSFLFIAAAFFVLNKSRVNKDLSKLSMVINNVIGDVSVDNVEAGKQTKFGESSIIKTGDNSSAEILFNDRILIKVTCNTILKIERAFYNKEEEKYNFSFIVKKGVVYSSFNNDDRKYKYRLKTPNSSIRSSGSEFLLSASGKKTVLLVSDGTMVIKSGNGDEVAAFRNQKYIVTDKISLKKITRKDKDLAAWIKDKKVISDKKTIAEKGSRELNVEVALTDKCGKLRSILEKGNPGQ